MLTTSQPMWYAWESVMINEFGDLSYQCSTADLAPSGAGFDSIRHQVCAVDGSLPGSESVSGAAFLSKHYGLATGHLWRNLGINIAIFVFFALSSGVGMEMHKPAAGTAVAVRYRRLEKSGICMSERLSDSDTADIELATSDHPETSSSNVPIPNPNEITRMSTHSGRTLSWQDLCLNISVKGGRKTLLDGLNGKIPNPRDASCKLTITGSVRPRELTALMGVSGAGKACAPELD
jgi:ATP-binding cassette, subfamily G (WHITE), member 2, SNQ2